MNAIAYSSPFIPPEWISAHGLQPSWMTLRGSDSTFAVEVSRSLCPFAGQVMHEAMCGLDAAAIVLTTSCDQMRYAAASLERRCDTPVFLVHIPATWQTRAAGELYKEELCRLGEFLVEVGGVPMTSEQTCAVMSAYDEVRASLRSTRPYLPSAAFARAVNDLRSGKLDCDWDSTASSPRGVPLVLVGGPLPENDHELLEIIERAGGQVVLDATEGGERTLPIAFDRDAARADPLAELARAYFGAIPDVFRRPNDCFYDWLSEQMANRQARGILFRRYLWCDVWHAELQRMREWSPIPVLDLDVSDDDADWSRTLGRIEAFLEMMA